MYASRASNSTAALEQVDALVRLAFSGRVYAACLFVRKTRRVNAAAKRGLRRSKLHLCLQAICLQQLRELPREHEVVLGELYAGQVLVDVTEHHFNLGDPIGAGFDGAAD